MDLPSNPNSNWIISNSNCVECGVREDVRQRG